ncbi:MAG: hypothetical protein SF052_27195 [Bacteroidia bacterium]|nr:hypothetical protein [Bacteroidia bacterium]
MVATSQLPVIFLACVNSYQSGKRLRFLVDERKEVARLLDAVAGPPLYQPVQKGNVSNEYFYDLLSENQYKDRVEIMHLTGLADEDHLRLESDNFEVPIHLEELSKTIGMFPNLKVVFLSGCATPGLLEMLLKRDIPAVIVTETTEKDPQTTEVATAFYKALAYGHSVQRAFDQVKAKFHRMKIHRVDYDVEQDTFTWRGKRTFEKRGMMDWGLYYMDDNLSRLSQRPRQISLMHLPLDKEYVETKRITRKVKALSFTAAVITLALLAFGVKLYLDSLEQLQFLSNF